MSTNARIGLQLADGSILSVYHHWDGYPEWLGVTLKEQYNTKKNIVDLIDGGNMSSCWSDNVYDYEKQEFVKRDPQPEYYGGDSEAPRLDGNFDEYAENANSGEEFLYVYTSNPKSPYGNWEAFAIDTKYDDNYKVVGTNIVPVSIPEVVS